MCCPGFSCQPMYTTTLIATYNMFWTGLPTIAHAVLEQVQRSQPTPSLCATKLLVKVECKFISTRAFPRIGWKTGTWPTTVSCNICRLTACSYFAAAQGESGTTLCNTRRVTSLLRITHSKYCPVLVRMAVSVTAHCRMCRRQS